MADCTEEWFNEEEAFWVFQPNEDGGRDAKRMGIEDRTGNAATAEARLHRLAKAIPVDKVDFLMPASF